MTKNENGMRKIIILSIFALLANSCNGQYNRRQILSMENMDKETKKSIIVSGHGIDDDPIAFEKAGSSALFVQEHASVSFNYYSNVFILNLTEESAQKIGNQKIGVVYVNNAAIIAPPYSENELITLEVFPIKANAYISKLSEFYQIPIYFCKHYEHKDNAQQSLMKECDNIEREITQFLEHPPAGDTIDQSFINMLVVNIDSRYTPLLIRNLKNNDEIIVKYIGHIHEVSGKIHEVISYKPIRISNFVRDRLEWDNVLKNEFNFKVPENNSSAEEWQIWLDELLKEKDYE